MSYKNNKLWCQQLVSLAQQGEIAILRPLSKGN